MFSRCMPFVLANRKQYHLWHHMSLSTYLRPVFFLCVVVPCVIGAMSAMSVYSEPSAACLGSCNRNQWGRRGSCGSVTRQMKASTSRMVCPESAFLFTGWRLLGGDDWFVGAETCKKNKKALNYMCHVFSPAPLKVYGAKNVWFYPGKKLVYSLAWQAAARCLSVNRNLEAPERCPIGQHTHRAECSGDVITLL